MWNIINTNRNKTKITPKIIPDGFNDHFYNAAKDLVTITRNNLHCKTDKVHNENVYNQFKFTGVTYNEVADVIEKLKDEFSKDVYGLIINIMKYIRELIITQ